MRGARLVSCARPGSASAPMAAPQIWTVPRGARVFAAAACNSLPPTASATRTAGVASGVTSATARSLRGVRGAASASKASCALPKDACQRQGIAGVTRNAHATRRARVADARPGAAVDPQRPAWAPTCALQAPASSKGDACKTTSVPTTRSASRADVPPSRRPARATANAPGAESASTVPARAQRVGQMPPARRDTAPRAFALPLRSASTTRIVALPCAAIPCNDGVLRRLRAPETRSAARTRSA